MTHDINLITTIAAALGFGLAFGLIAVRLRLPALVGYLAAGILIGPATPGFVADMQLSSQLAEIGVMLLMFGVGLHFSLDDLMQVRRIALPGALLQIAAATAMGVLLAQWWGWSFGAGLVFGLALSVASTVVLLRALEDLHLLDSINGRIAVGWLVVEDLVTVLMLVMLPALSGPLGGAQSGDGGPLWQTLAATLGRVAAFVAFMLIVGRKLFPWLLWRVAKTESRELFTLCVIAAAVGIAYGASHVFGVSFALGAFFAGMVLRESALSHRAAEESLPLRDAFSVLFFVSVGMLFDPRVLISHPWQVLAVIAVIVFGKSLAAFALVRLLRYPLHTALTVSASLAQIGEFSFILAGLGVSLGLLPVQGQSLILAGAILSIALNPAMFRLASLAQRHDAAPPQRHPDPLAELPMTVPQERLNRHVVLVGYGRVGKRIAAELEARGIAYVVIEQNRERVGRQRERGLAAVAGDAAEPGVLIQAHIARAAMLVVAAPDAFEVRRMIATARSLNPQIRSAVRSHSDAEAELLREESADRVFVAERELADSMARHVLEQMAVPQPA